MKDAANSNRYRSAARSHDPANMAYLESTLGYRIKLGLVALYREIYESLGDTDLTLVQFSVLCIALDNPGIAQSEIASALGVERPRLVPIIDSLEQRDLAERRPNPIDRRSRMIFLTPKGETCVKSLKKNFDAHQAQLRSRMGGDKFDSLMDALDWIVKNTQK
ncbi:MarR family winged helix-turn-helix transcriptional regulator [Ruegeria sp.]|uniref:MarR family winged helix-turn-helix transcriptional regulator n=1 Tax=Ruegeria sp. TaxID=1879320 RepID=UPI003B5B2833